MMELKNNRIPFIFLEIFYCFTDYEIPSTDYSTTTLFCACGSEVSDSSCQS